MTAAGPKVTPDLAVAHGLSREEYDRIIGLLGREPTYTELGLFSALWSEHCSYKSSRTLLKRLPSRGPHVLQGPGENAGVVDLGDGLALAMKIESHNHPSFIEPFQGAATGVGGILRDIFTMGARPLCLLDSLRFGPPDHPATGAGSGYLLGGVVAGIAHYGNCFGCPTVGGEVGFAPEYAKNPLVNVLCLGLIARGRIFRARAEGVGNTFIYVGAKTGRDGIHGATMASESFDETSSERRPTVQVGDPFTEKLLLEACLEAMATGAIVGIQDMGAAGLACSLSEMPARAGTGAEIELDRVPQRESAMTPYELLLSESQERMLLVVTRGREAEVQRVFAKWELDAVPIGRVTGDGVLRVRMHGELVAEVPVRALTDDAPAYDRPRARPAWLDAVRAFDPATVPEPADPTAVLLHLLAAPTIASKASIWRQYDHMVGINTLVVPGSDAAVLRLKGTGKAVAVATDGNGRYAYLDPFQGGAMAVAEAARNVVCAGGRPLAMTDCLNFGSPERPEIMWQFAEAVNGIAEACRVLEIPVVGGNVSFYNETLGQAILPTPIVGVVGLLADAERRTTQWFKEPGDLVILLGDPAGGLGGSEYLATLHGRLAGTPAPLDLARERAVQAACLAAIEAGCVRSAHDCAEGGLAVALAEGCVTGPRPLGAEVALDGAGRLDARLFGEAPSRIVVSVPPGERVRFERIVREWAVPVTALGRVGGDQLTIRVDGQVRIAASLAAMAAAFGGSFERLVGGATAPAATEGAA
ncbi:MAG TPA: phosphoribosylformylglycinamidine synthase subunit PurL [Methylomirabilota bacterium]|nr:phosphoribosylformylglycinamidine synthase subunit PurL [Methylomirabilota bacterium]